MDLSYCGIFKGGWKDFFNFEVLNKLLIIGDKISLKLLHINTGTASSLQILFAYDEIILIISSLLDRSNPILS